MKGKHVVIFLTALFVLLPLNGIVSAEDSGRQVDDVDCSGYSFEDLFEYDNAVFMFEILDDWATSDLYANSWVNESRAATVRDNLDSLFDGFPGGNNDWLSTDERDAVREIGAKCIADMYTRIGIREGIPHRGAISWNNATFVEEGIGLEEVNLIPDGHPEERDCSTRYAFASSDCREVPTTATNNLEISMFVKEGETHNTRFTKLPNSGQSNFTVAMNVTNMPLASMVFTFPYIDGLRMANYSIQDDGVENPLGATIEEIFLPDGSVRISVGISYEIGVETAIRNIFIDMTTTPPESNEHPVWTVNAPKDNTIIPILNDGMETLAIKGETMESWATDDDAWGLDCEFNEEGWSSRMMGTDLFVTPGQSSSGTADCSLIDPYGAKSEVIHTWRFGQPATITADAGIYSDSVDITVTPTMLVQSIAMSLAPNQDLSDGASTNFNLGSTATTQSVSLSGVGPGLFHIHVIGNSEGMLNWDVIMNLNLEKKNTPPTLVVYEDEIEGGYATWSSDQYSFTLSGSAFDPDGTLSSLSATMCGQTTTSFTTEGTNWVVSLSIAKCVADGFTQYDVVISAQDDVGDITYVDISVPDPFAEDNEGNTDDTGAPEEEAGLPSIGVFASIIAILSAALILRRD